MNILKPSLIVILLMFSAQAIFAQDAPPTRVVAVPRFEAEKVMENWLKGEGYQVTLLSGRELDVLKGSRMKAEWEISLKPDSPLATIVTVKKSPEKGAEELWKYLDTYMKGDPTIRTVAGPGVPKPVQDRMGLVVCIKEVAARKPAQLTGFVVDTSGLILCTAHTLQLSDLVSITLSGGETLEGRVVRIDFEKDLALIDCNYRFDGSIDLNNDGPVPADGQPIFSIGCPLDVGGMVFSGTISGPPRITRGQPLLQARMEVEPGSSGSPVFDAGGHLIAIVKGRVKGNNLQGLFIPMETAISFVKEK